MATLTINVNPETLERAEKKAAEQGTSVDQVVETYLAAYANHVGQPIVSSTDNGVSNTARKPNVQPGLSLDERKELVQSLKEIWALADTRGVRSGGITWKREDLYDRDDRDGWGR